MRGITMRTTIYINTILLGKLKEAASEINLPKNELITLLVSRIIKKNHFAPKPCVTVKYQKSRPGIEWKIEHIKLEAVYYEKVLDFRRHYKTI
jgi:hypothetical protein